MDEQHRDKQGRFKKGHKIAKGCTSETSYWLGKKRGPLSEDHKLRISAALKGIKRGPMSSDTKDKIRLYVLSNPLPIEVLRKGATKRMGELNPSWKGGITPVNHKIRNSSQYKEWRASVFKRDGYRCFDCGQLGGNLEADHILPFAYFPRLRFDINNGITRCKECHRSTDTWGRKCDSYMAHFSGKVYDGNKIK